MAPPEHLESGPNLERIPEALPLDGWPVGDLDISYRPADRPATRQVFRDGCLVAWVADDGSPADLTVSWGADELARLWSSPSSLTSAEVSSLALATPASSQPYGLLPGDPASLRHLAALPRIPGATLTIRYEVTGTFAPLLVLEHGIRDGRVAEASWGATTDTGVVVHGPWSWVLDLLRGQCSLLELIHHGEVSGDIWAMSVATGILESEEHRAAWCEHEAAYDAIDDWVALVSSHAADVLRARCARSSP